MLKTAHLGNLIASVYEKIDIILITKSYGTVRHIFQK